MKWWGVGQEGRQPGDMSCSLAVGSHRAATATEAATSSGCPFCECGHSFLVSRNLRCETSQHLVTSALGNKDRSWGDLR